MQMSKAIFIWTSFCAFLFLLILKVDEIVYWNWFIIFIPMWSFDFMLFTTSILCMSRKFTHIVGQHNVGSRLGHTLILSFILWKLTAQIILCLSLEGHLKTLLDSFSQSYIVSQTSNSNETGNSTEVKALLVYAVFPLWTTMVVCLIIVCAQIVNPPSTGIRSFFSNNQPCCDNNERRRQRKTDVSTGFVKKLKSY
ncbi:unnamed protein product [Schistosoma rodhaini]|nr:unnamed protein product [Schistosoma rodhaini]